MYAKLKILIKFGSLEIVFVKMRSKKLFKLSLNQYVKLRCICTRSHTCEGPILCRKIIKLSILNMYTKPKVLFKFGSLEVMYVEMR